VDGSGTFVSLLKKDGVKVTVRDYGDGTHSWPYWDREFRLSLPLLLDALGEPPLPTNASPSATQ
jgi:S-formylglutathione hydrolase FrmB